MVRQHHQLHGHEFEQTLGDSEGQESLCVLQSMRLQRLRDDLAAKQNQQNKNSGPQTGEFQEVKQLLKLRKTSRAQLSKKMN